MAFFSNARPRPLITIKCIWEGSIMNLEVLCMSQASNTGYANWDRSYISLWALTPAASMISHAPE